MSTRGSSNGAPRPSDARLRLRLGGLEGLGILREHRRAELRPERPILPCEALANEPAKSFANADRPELLALVVLVEAHSPEVADEVYNLCIDGAGKEGEEDAVHGLAAAVPPYHLQRLEDVV